MNNFSNWSRVDDVQLSNANQLVSEAIINLRTIKALGENAVHDIVERYAASMTRIQRRDSVIILDIQLQRFYSAPAVGDCFIILLSLTVVLNYCS